MIHFSNVTKRYTNGYEALNEVSFHVGRGEMVFLTGHSGAGKSTLLKMIPLIERPSAGQVIIDDKHLGRVKRRHIPALRRDIGIIFQDSKLLNDRNVFDNVALPLLVSGDHHPREVGRRVRAALDKVGLLSREHDFPISLSGGERQRVGIARAVVNRPKLLLADEPTGNLDPALSREIMALFEQFNQVGVTVLIASHDLELIGRLEKRILALRRGRMVADQGGELGAQTG
ncbi:cell division ATP-binding protein FtsE [Candidatus Tenderia electrophaga]|jgi:cell division transport system ATP-binding protein|uniref:Cell division ATP-binding protein FtsE n=1 Tax=Candidatus Tenderia electrophaga TaxID=1748243 RepID=A0A0S2T9F0_9GAMM|nr:cell division ATP-binding protein FtsE [Candidatus Tenderia electrophaga]